MPYNKDEFGYEASAIQGAATLKRMLDCIGEDVGPHTNPTVMLVDDEMPLRALLTYALGKFADDI